MRSTDYICTVSVVIKHRSAQVLWQVPGSNMEQALLPSNSVYVLIVLVLTVAMVLAAAAVGAAAVLQLHPQKPHCVGD